MFASLLMTIATLTGCATWVTHDPGDPATGQYPATVVHYAGHVAEDDAGDDCDARGGSLVDEPAERFVCVVD